MSNKIHNPYRKSCKRKANKLTPKAPKPRCGTAQVAFIEQTRLAIDADPFYFHKHQWTRIGYGGNRHTALTQPKKITVDFFYVKDLVHYAKSYRPFELFVNENYKL